MRQTKTCIFIFEFIFISKMLKVVESFPFHMT